MIRGAWLALGLLLSGDPWCAEADAPPGALVPVFDTMLHLLCVGQGAPTVMLEAGLGGNFLDWTFVQPALAENHRVCSYDRAGAGFSRRTQRPRTAAIIAEELHELARVAEIPRPFVLLGHSFGGLLAMTYARRYPADVAGLVLLDSMHPDQFERFAAAGVRIETDPHLVLGRTPASAAQYGLPDHLRRLALDLALADSARVFVVREMSLMQDSARALRDLGLPRLPARVLSHGNGEWRDVPPPGRMEAVWAELQADLANRLGAPPPVAIANSGHQLALDAPDAVVAATNALVATIR